MSYSESIMKWAIELGRDGLTAEQIAKIYNEEILHGDYDFELTPKTIRSWLEADPLHKEKCSNSTLISFEKHSQELISAANSTCGAVGHLLEVKKHGRFDGFDTEAEMYGAFTDGGIRLCFLEKPKIDIPFSTVKQSKLSLKCLLEHLHQKHPEIVVFENWDYLNVDTVTDDLLDVLELLIHSENIAPCSSCPACKELGF